VILCIGRHSVFAGLNSVSCCQHLSVYSQGLLGIFFSLSTSMLFVLL